MEFSPEVIARILYYIPLSPAKLAMQGVSNSFRQALKTRQAHPVAAQVTFPLEDSHPPCTSRDILRVTPFVCLGPRHKDFSWVAFLDHVQVLACNYDSLCPVSPLQTIQELTLDCISKYGAYRNEQCEYSSKISLAHLFPSVRRLRLHAIPVEDSGDGQNYEYRFFKDLQLMTLQRMVIYDYPDPYVALLAQSPDWAYVEVNFNSGMYGQDAFDPFDNYIPDFSAVIISSVTLHNIEALHIRLSIFGACSSLEDLTFGLNKIMVDSDSVQITGVQSLSKTCGTLHFQDFIPHVQDLSELLGWRCESGKGRSTISHDEACPFVVKVSEVNNCSDKYFKLIKSAP